MASCMQLCNVKIRFHISMCEENIASFKFVVMQASKYCLIGTSTSYSDAANQGIFLRTQIEPPSQYLVYGWWGESVCVHEETTRSGLPQDGET